MDDLNAMRQRDAPLLLAEPEKELSKDDCEGVIEENSNYRKATGLHSMGDFTSLI